jgi:hypothetical protein
MGKIKDLLLAIEEVNVELSELAEDQREERVQQIWEELMNDHELLRQYEAMAYAAELENFSPFDTINS